MIKLWKAKVLSLKLLQVLLIIIAVPATLGMCWYGLPFILASIGWLLVFCGAFYSAAIIAAIFDDQVFTTIENMWVWWKSWPGEPLAYTWSYVTKNLLPYMAFGIVVILSYIAIEQISQKITEIKEAAEESWDKVKDNFFVFTKTMRLFSLLCVLYISTAAVSSILMASAYPEFQSTIGSTFLGTTAFFNWAVTYNSIFFIVFALVAGFHSGTTWKGNALAIMQIYINMIVIYVWWHLLPFNTASVVMYILATIANLVTSKYRSLEPVKD